MEDKKDYFFDGPDELIRILKRSAYGGLFKPTVYLASSFDISSRDFLPIDEYDGGCLGSRSHQLFHFFNDNFAK